MNTAFFSFFVFYVLVVLVVLIGFFWQDARFYWLSIVNLIALVLYFLFSFVLEKKQQSDIQAHSVAEEKEKTTDHASHHTQHQQFVKFSYAATHKKTKKRRKLWISLLIALFLFVSLMAFRPQIKTVLNSLFTQNTLSLTGKGEVIGSGFSDILTGDFVDITGSVIATGLEESGVVLDSAIDESFLGDTQTGSTEESTGSVEEVKEPEVSASSALKEKLGLTDAKGVTMMDAIIYLLDSNNVPLSLDKTVKFTYVTTKNPYYAYWKTAYDKKLLGKDTNPSKLIMCETYMTLKGMIEAWDVKYTSATVKTAYWAEAKKRDVVGDCVYGKVVRGANL